MSRPNEIRRERFDGSRFLDSPGPLHFSDCSFRGVRFEASRGGAGSLAESSFADCRFEGCYFGPATLDLAKVSFQGATLSEVEFMLGRLPGANFDSAELQNVTFRRADLTGASFKDALLFRVCFEKAKLSHADFTGAQFTDLDYWGEPPWDDAIIDDAVRYSFGIVQDPVHSISELLHSRRYSAEQVASLERLQIWLREWAPPGETIMLLYREVSDEFDLTTFTWMLRELKAPANHSDSADGTRRFAPGSAADP